MSSPEHFTKTLFGGGARRSMGYKIFFNSPKSVEYVDGETKIFVSAEPLAPKQTIQLFRAHVTVGSSDGPIVADEGLRARVLDRVRRAGRFLGWSMV